MTDEFRSRRWCNASIRYWAIRVLGARMFSGAGPQFSVYTYSNAKGLLMNRVCAGKAARNLDPPILRYMGSCNF